MTHPITPADREAFLRLNNQPPEWAAKIRAGDFDDCSTLQLLAGHRIEGERAKAAEIVAELRDLDGRRDESNLIGWAANHIEAKFGAERDEL